MRRATNLCDVCRREPVDEDAFCPGCDHYVCEFCDETMPVGKHGVRDHVRRQPSEEPHGTHPR